jgi:hypothetical protein
VGRAARGFNVHHVVEQDDERDGAMTGTASAVTLDQDEKVAKALGLDESGRPLRERNLTSDAC